MFKNFIVKLFSITALLFSFLLTRKIGRTHPSGATGAADISIICFNLWTNWSCDAKVYEGLFDYDNDGKMVPAESYEIAQMEKQ